MYDGQRRTHAAQWRTTGGLVSATRGGDPVGIGTNRLDAATLAEYLSGGGRGGDTGGDRQCGGYLPRVDGDRRFATPRQQAAAELADSAAFCLMLLSDQAAEATAPEWEDPMPP